MSHQHITVHLGDHHYTIPALNIGQLEQVTDALLGPPTKAAFAILKVALQRASPTPDLATLAPQRDQVALAVREILALSGFEPERKGDLDPNGAAPGAPGAAS